MKENYLLLVLLLLSLEDLKHTFTSLPLSREILKYILIPQRIS